MSRTAVKSKERQSIGTFHQVRFRVTPASFPNYRAQLYPEDEEHKFQINRANFAASRVISISNLKSNRSGRGGGRGGRGGRGGGRSGGRNPKQKDKSIDRKSPDDEQAGEKRKRGVEPDGGPLADVRGTTVPVVRSTSKRAKTES